MTAHLPALQVVLPLLCALVCALLRSPFAAWLGFVVAAAASAGVSALLAARIASGGVARYAMGGWEPPAGIELVVDGANVPVLVLLSGIAVVVAVYARRSIESEIDRRRIPLFYACLCLALTGLLGITVTGDAFNLFVFLEISSLASYALVALGRRRRALLAAFQYLIVGTIGGTFLLIGVGLAYAVTGTLNMADLSQRLPEIYGNRALTAAVVFIFVGLGIKMAVFPLHTWLPGAYAEAPSAVSVFLAATGTKVAIYAFMRFAFTVFGAELVFDRLPIGQIGLLVASLAMLIGSAVACVQEDFKRLLAWSSIAQVGYIVAGLSLATSGGISAAYLHLMIHAMTKGALFCAAGLLLVRVGATSLSSIAGLRRRMPATFAVVIIAGLGLVGVPPTAGFVSKWALASALVESGQWVVLAVLLVSSLLALVYVGRVVEAGWFRTPPEAAASEPVASEVVMSEVSAPSKAPASMMAATWLLALASLYFGIEPSWLSSLADGAAAALLGGGR